MAAVSKIDHSMLSKLRACIQKKETDYRFQHTLGVEKEIIRLGKIYLPDDIPLLQAAALLHDVTKEYTKEQHFAVFKQYHFTMSEDETRAPQLYHAWSAALLIPDTYPAFADPVLIKAIWQHTTGDVQMSEFSKLLYLADYIEETRTFADCITLRESFWQSLPSLKSQTERLRHLDEILLMSYEMTISALKNTNSWISPVTLAARNALIEEINKHN